MFKIARFVENIFYISIDMETPTVHNTYAIVISVGYYLLLFLQIDHRKILYFRQKRGIGEKNTTEAQRYHD